MKKNLILGAVITAFLLSFTPSSEALVIGFDPIEQMPGVAESVSVDLFISELGDGTAPSLGIFDLDVNYDFTILDFDSVVFGDQLDLFGLGSLTSVDDTVVGSVNLFELSLDFADDLDLLQAQSFTLATLTFNTLSIGTSSLDIVVNDLGDSIGVPLYADDIRSGSISPVPEPATILLVMSGMAGLGIFGRKRFRK